jgi:hypothetical protein
MRLPTQHQVQAWLDHCHQKHQPVVLRQVLPPYFDPSSLCPKPSSISHRHEYLQVDRLVQQLVWVGAGRQKEAAAGQGEEVDRHLLVA